ncbi:LysR substrate-binding domain-containing protein [Bradyrhizobium sp. NP1]|uniref:LysR family transcriptional regulator n=1 Tax=Bradyrhizobium sp. NP1 TaxID=3049772 RepID=UPI0025A5D235|nr:LysR substrate-binding domain-containing protein [Bradyrhizobium sp. NP1]WJR79997.1 LysR substrate-binding domain-containing protein [Bradyrhizobium sp. NP1]
MEIRLLEMFRTVLDTGSVTHAAASLGVTQPAVSAQLARLEQELGFALFERAGKRLRPTPEALAFRGTVDRMLARIDFLERSVEDIKLGRDGSLVVASHPMASTALLPAVIARFARERPAVRLQVLTRNSDQVRMMFPSAMHDIGIAEVPIDPTGLNVRRYGMECVAIMPKGHPLAARKVVTPRAMSNLPYVGVSREWYAHHVVSSVFSDAGARLNLVASADQFVTICALVASGVGVSVVDPASAEQFRCLGIEVRRFEPAVPYEIAAFASAERELSVVGKAFLAAFDAEVSRFVRKP